MALSIDLEKTWIIECFDFRGNRNVRGGICVSEGGAILTTWAAIKPKIIRGRNHGTELWVNLEPLIDKSNFGLVLYKVERSARVGFSWFNLHHNLRGNVDLRRCDVVHALFHREDNPFASFFGFASRPFRRDEVEFPDMESDLTLNMVVGDSREEILNAPIPFPICTKHVLDIDSQDDDTESSSTDEYDFSDVHSKSTPHEHAFSDQDSEMNGEEDLDSDDSVGVEEHSMELEGILNVMAGSLGIQSDTGMADSLEIHSDEGDLESDDDDVGGVGVPVIDGGSGNTDTDSDTDSDVDDEYQLDILHPDIPLIQVHGLGTGFGSLGCPVFNQDNNLIGLFFFTRSTFQYILPIQFLHAFLAHSIASRKERRERRRLRLETRKRKGIESVGTAKRHKVISSSLGVLGPENSQRDTSDKPQSGNLRNLPLHTKGKELISAHQFKDAREVLGLGKDVESVADIFNEAKDKKAEKLAEDQKCRVEIKLQNASVEEVTAEAHWRQENDGGLTNPVIKSEIQLDLKSKKRRRHQGHVEARVSQLAAMGFDRSKGGGFPIGAAFNAAS